MRAFFYVTLIFIITTPNKALDLQEKLQSVVLKVYPENIIALSRGVEDGVKFNDHIRLTQNKVFIGRAISIKILPKVSFWKVYRTPKGALQMGHQYLITSIPLSEVRPAVLREISSIKLDFLSNETQEILLKK